MPCGLLWEALFQTISGNIQIRTSVDKATEAVVDPHAGLGSSRHVVTEQLVKGKPESISAPLTAISEKPMITDMTKNSGRG